MAEKNNTIDNDTLKNYGIKMFNDKPNRKICLILEIMEDGSFNLSTMDKNGGIANDLADGNSIDSIKKDINYYKTLFLKTIKIIDNLI